MGDWYDAHPAPDLDAPPPAGDDSPIARGFIQLGQAWWLRLDTITSVAFNTGPGPDECTIRIAGDGQTAICDQDARDFWVAWTAYLRGDE